MPKKIIVIVGLGLMGGSLALALKSRSKSFRIFGISRSPQKIRQAIRNHIIDQGSTRFEDIPRNTDLVCIATPVPQIAPAVLQIDKALRLPAIVTDVGSTKEQILNDLARVRLKKARFVGSHPMAGDHSTGLEAARKDLYKGALVFLTRDHASPALLKKLASFWRSAGATRVVRLSAKEHDRIVAEVSQLPHLIASILALAVRPENISFSGPGFRDATRIAQGDPELWTGIVSSNKNLISQLRRFEKKLKKLRGLVQRKNWSRLRKLLQESSQRRKSLNAMTQ